MERLKQTVKDHGYSWNKVSSLQRTYIHLCSSVAASSDLRRCVKVEVADLCSPSLIVLMVSVDVKQQ